MDKLFLKLAIPNSSYRVSKIAAKFFLHDKRGSFETQSVFIVWSLEVPLLGGRSIQ